MRVLTIVWSVVALLSLGAAVRRAIRAARNRKWKKLVMSQLERGRWRMRLG